MKIVNPSCTLRTELIALKTLNIKYTQTIRWQFAVYHFVELAANGRLLSLQKSSSTDVWHDTNDGEGMLRSLKNIIKTTWADCVWAIKHRVIFLL